ncbi:MAG: HepT-like ribonuclease domain-containing protein [Synechococcaceae cyanobacterium]|nr:HepT-like ribonuclease domain-containing protein [Synechococcaceae cyanobacterium]
MRRDPRAFLSDVIEAGHAILQAVAGIGLDDYCDTRLIRSSVEREFTIIGEALTQLSQRDSELFAQIEQAPQIITFRNKLAHEYSKVNSQLVWGIIETDLPMLVERCSQLLSQLNEV